MDRIGNMIVDQSMRERFAGLGITVRGEQDANTAFVLQNERGSYAYLVSNAGLVAQLMDAQQGYVPGRVEIVESLELLYILEGVFGRDTAHRLMRQGDLPATLQAFDTLGGRLATWGFDRALTGDTWSVFCMLKMHPFNRMRHVRTVAIMVSRLRDAGVSVNVLRDALLAVPRGARWLERATDMALMWAEQPHLHPRLLADIFA